MVFGNPDYWADTMRWWSMTGALMGSHPLVKHMKFILQLYKFDKEAMLELPIRLALWRTAALICFIIFSFIAGTVLPLTSRIPELHLDSMEVKLSLSIAWTFIGLGSWAVALSYARKPWITFAAAWSWFLAVSFAALAYR